MWLVLEQRLFDGKENEISQKLWCKENIPQGHLCNYTRLNSNIILWKCIVKVILLCSPLPPHPPTLTTTPKGNSKSISGIKKMKLKDFMNREEECFQWKRLPKQILIFLNPEWAWKMTVSKRWYFQFSFSSYGVIGKNQHSNPKQNERKTYNKFLCYFSLEKCLCAGMPLKFLIAIEAFYR